MKHFRNHALALALAMTAGSVAAASVTFYQEDNFRGTHVTADRAVANFAGSGFNDGARSAVVHDGRWEICVDADFGGSCSVLAPGAYPVLGAYAGRVSSVRPIVGNYSGAHDSDQSAGSNSGRSDVRGRRAPAARATLYEGSNLAGRSYQLREAMYDMSGSGLNDRASSLRVVGGYWIFCSDANFRGECRTFGPGDYTTLPGMNNRISSGRLISNAYPYADLPDWQRGEWNHHSQSQQGRQN